MYRTLVLVVLACILATSHAGAGDVSDELRERLSQRLQEFDPEIRLDRVEATPLPGIYQVVAQGQVAYMSEDGRYLVQGDIVDLEVGASLSDAVRGELVIDQLEAHGEERMIVYTPPDGADHTVTVFTDIDCPYCRQMHQRMDDYHAEGIEIRYVQMPRAGVGTGSYHKAVSVYCADDQLAAMDAAKAGETPEQRECDNPVESQLELARSIGVNATPTFIDEQGRMHRGLVEPADLASRLQQ